VKIAVVHEWLVEYAGSERVLEQILHCYPSADLFALVDFLPDGARGFLQGKTVTTTFLQKVPLARRHYQQYLALMPLAIEQLDLSGYDLVISSNHAVAKGIITSPDQLHVSYVHSPMRYAWDLQHQYLREAGMQRGLRSVYARSQLHKLRIWDVRTANGVDRFVANSEYISRRIWKAYRRESVVVYPPVDTQWFLPGGERQDYYLAAGRMVPYKKMGLLVEAFTAMPERRLRVIGDGPLYDRIRRGAGANIEFLGHRPAEDLRELLQGARALVYAAEEDFGILPVEAQACGTPVIGFGRGGLAETVRPLETESPTGVLFQEQALAAIREAVNRFEASGGSISPDNCRKNAERFSVQRFRDEFSALVDGAYAEYLDRIRSPAS
jgi:glycosyltransferase involved in cell wall biosynthesis